MVVGAIGGRTEVAIIGSGPGGYVAALRAADAGKEVTLVERGPLGGTCLNVGCIPSKTLIETAGLLHGSVDPARGLIGERALDMTAVAAHLRGVSNKLRTGVEHLVSAAGITVVPGTAHFARYDRLSIEHDGAVTHLDFDGAIIATGSSPVAMPALPFDERVLDSTGALGLTALPSRLVIVGAGYIGVELGTAFAKLGSDVTLVEAASSVLPEVPAAIRAPVERRLTELGISVRVSTRAVGSGVAGLEIDDGSWIPADRIVVAVGRRSNGDQCSAEVAGVKVRDDGTIVVDEHLMAARNIYAIGDVIAGPALAHRASNDAERAAAHLCGLQQPAPLAIPAVIFSDPEVLLVGEPITDAADRGFHVHRFPHGAIGRALTLDATSGATWLVTDSAGTIVGVHAVGPHVSELAGEAVLAIEMAATITDVRLSVHPHPTMTESIAEAAWLAAGAPLHIRR